MDETDYRNRILDAAEACLLERRMSAPLHAVIAERAGVSRPTVYKYVGDQDAIFRAVLDREAGRYVAAITPELSRPLPLLEHFARLSGFSVVWFRDSALWSAVRANDGQQLLSWMTEEFERIIREGIGPLVPLLHERLPATRTMKVPIEDILEWGVRLTISLVFMPSATRPMESAEQIEAYVADFLRAFAEA